MVEKATPGPDSTNILGYGKGGLGEDPSKGPMMIGGTHRVSTKVNPSDALAGRYTSIEGDAMPAGAPAVGEGNDPPYIPQN